MTAPVEFIFAVCQLGAEGALKAELARGWPEFRLAFSRPGFVTFKLPEGLELAADFDLRSTFARAYGFSLGRAAGSDAGALAERVWELAGDRVVDDLHVWQRDAAVPGERGFLPGVTPLAAEVADTIAAARPARAAALPLRVNRRTRAGQHVLDVVLVEPDQWWIGYHRAATLPSRWPGGVFPLAVNKRVISRAYFKMSEALAWSQLPLAAGDRCAELGSSPGGAAQALLERGLLVLGVDPAEMDESLLAHDNFVHLRRRAADVRRRDFRGVKWLMADLNVAPQYTLDAVEAIVTDPQVHVRGLLLTLKLLEWELAEHLPQYFDRIRSWGYADVRARQLACNRQEVCVAALRSRALRRTRKAPASRRRQPADEGPAKLS